MSIHIKNGWRTGLVGGWLLRLEDGTTSIWPSPPSGFQRPWYVPDGRETVQYTPDCRHTRGLLAAPTSSRYTRANPTCVLNQPQAETATFAPSARRWQH